MKMPMSLTTRARRAAAALSLLSLALTGTAQAANGLETYAYSIAGYPRIGSAGGPLSCSQGGPSALTLYFSPYAAPLGTPVEGAAACGVAADGGMLKTAPNGTLTSSSRLNADFSPNPPFDVRRYDGSSFSRAGFDSLGARAGGSYSGGDSFPGSGGGSEAFARSTEAMRLPGTGFGVYRITLSIDGAMSFYGRSISLMQVTSQVNGGPAFPRFVLRQNNGSFGFIDSNGLVPGLLPGWSYTPGDALTPARVSGRSDVVFDVPVPLGTFFDLTLGLYVESVPGSSVGQTLPSSADTDFSTTVKLTGLELFVDGKSVDFSVESGSGTLYGRSGVISTVPEPATSGLMGLGVLAAAAVARARRRAG